jgi:hypothetical protein
MFALIGRFVKYLPMTMTLCHYVSDIVSGYSLAVVNGQHSISHDGEEVASVCDDDERRRSRTLALASWVEQTAASPLPGCRINTPTRHLDWAYLAGAEQTRAETNTTL